MISYTGPLVQHLPQKGTVRLSTPYQYASIYQLQAEKLPTGLLSKLSVQCDSMCLLVVPNGEATQDYNTRFSGTPAPVSRHVSELARDSTCIRTRIKAVSDRVQGPTLIAILPPFNNLTPSYAKCHQQTQLRFCLAKLPRIYLDYLIILSSVDYPMEK